MSSKTEQFVVAEESTIVWLFEALQRAGFFDRTMDRKMSWRAIEDASMWHLSDDPRAPLNPIMRLSIDWAAVDMAAEASRHLNRIDTRAIRPAWVNEMVKSLDAMDAPIEIPGLDFLDEREQK